MSPKPVIHAIGPEFIHREGLSEIPQPREDGLRAQTGPGNFEWWYFDFHLDDGSRAVIVYMTKPLLRRNDPLTPLLTFTLTLPGGERISRWASAPPESFHASAETCDVAIGPSTVRGDLRSYSLHAEAGELCADLTLNAVVPAWRPGAGKSYFDRGLTSYFGWLAAVPHGTVSGTLTYNGETHTVTGSGYHDHNWGNLALNKVLSHWYWGRARVDDLTTIYVEMVTTPAYGSLKLPVFMLAQGERILTGDGAPLTLTLAGMEAHPSGHEIPTRLYFDWRSGGSVVHLLVHQPELIEEASLLAGFTPTQAWIARRFANPYYFRFQSRLSINIDLAGVRRHAEGTTLFEYMRLH